MDIPVIINSESGTVRAHAEEFSETALRRRFESHGVSPRLHYTSGDQVQAAVRELANSGAESLVVGGGDGTIGGAVDVMARTDINLGVLPLGTLNHFAKDLGIGEDVDTAIQTIAAGNIRAVDYATVNGRAFVNNCSLGAYPAAVRRREWLRDLHGYRKWSAMSLAMFEVLRNLKRFPAEIICDGERRLRRTPLILVSNNRYAGTIFSKNLRPQLDAGRLWIYSVRVHRIMPVLRLGAMALLGKLDAAEEFELWPAREAQITLPGKTITLAIDGEITQAEVPLQIQIHPRVLRVFAPAPSSS